MRRLKSDGRCRSSSSRPPGPTLLMRRRPHITGRTSSFGRTTFTPLRFLWNGCSRTTRTRCFDFSEGSLAVNRDHGFDGGNGIRDVHSPRNVQDERTRHDASHVQLYPHIESRDVDSSDVSCPFTSTHDEGAAVQCAEPPTCSAAPRAGENLSGSGHDRPRGGLPDGRGL